MGHLFWVLWRKDTAKYWECTIFHEQLSHDTAQHTAKTKVEDGTLVKLNWLKMPFISQSRASYGIFGEFWPWNMDSILHIFVLLVWNAAGHGVSFVENSISRPVFPGGSHPSFSPARVYIIYTCTLMTCRKNRNGSGWGFGDHWVIMCFSCWEGQLVTCFITVARATLRVRLKRAGFTRRHGAQRRGKHAATAREKSLISHAQNLMWLVFKPLFAGWLILAISYMFFLNIFLSQIIVVAKV